MENANFVHPLVINVVALRLALKLIQIDLLPWVMLLIIIIIFYIKRFKIGTCPSEMFDEGYECIQSNHEMKYRTNLVTFLPILGATPF